MEAQAFRRRDTMKSEFPLSPRSWRHLAGPATLFSATALMLQFAAPTFANSISASASQPGIRSTDTSSNKRTWQVSPPGVNGVSAATLTWVAGVDTEDGKTDP